MPQQRRVLSNFLNITSLTSSVNSLSSTHVVLMPKFCIHILSVSQLECVAKLERGLRHMKIIIIDRTNFIIDLHGLPVQTVRNLGNYVFNRYNRLWMHLTDTTDTFGSQNFRTFSPRQIAFMVAERPMPAELLRLQLQCAGDIEMNLGPDSSPTRTSCLRLMQWNAKGINEKNH